MATLSFLAGENFEINYLSGSGLGFYGSDGFGASVPVGEYQGRTFITNGAGTSHGSEADNIAFLNSGSGVIGQAGSGIGLQYIPNYQATLQIRFTHDTPVQCTSAKLYGYDRTSINNEPSGVTLKAFEIIRPQNDQAAPAGSGDDTWTTLEGTGSYLDLCPSPGVSGLYAGNGSNSTWADTTHDWFVGLSASPDSIGSKTFGGYFSCEYY